MFNPHPPLTSFPVVLLALTVLCELLHLLKGGEYWRWAVRKLLICLCVFSPLTYFSGYWFGVKFANKATTVPEDVIANHQTYAQIYLLSLFLCVLFFSLDRAAEGGKILLRRLYYIFLLSSFVLVVLTSQRGGKLVFEHGAGVSKVSIPSEPAP